MKNLLPTISYVVQTQFLTNNAGLKYLYQRKFTSENILEARRKAQEYYDCAIEVLEAEGEILKDENGKIFYKNPQNYDGGIKMWLYVNHDFFRENIADKQGQKYLLAGHFEMNAERKRQIKFGKMMQERYFDALKIKEPFTPNKELLAYRIKPLLDSTELRKLRKLTTEEAEFIKFRDKELPEKILETACAFLNSKGGTIILGQTREMRQKNSTRKLQDDLLIIEKLLKCEFPKFVQNLKCSVEYLQGIRFVKIEVAKSSEDAFYNEEFFIRTKYGNAVDWAKTFEGNL